MLRPAHRRGFRRAAGYAWRVGSTRLLITARWLPASERRAAVEWRWTNDPLGGPDEDHARCIAASGSRILEYRGHSFVLTTHECAPGTVLDDGRPPLAGGRGDRPRRGRALLTPPRHPRCVGLHKSSRTGKSVLYVQP